MKRTLKKLFRVVLFVILLALLVHTALLLYWGLQLHRTLAAIRAAGDPITVAQTAPKPIPDDRNSAIVYKQVLDLCDKVWQTNPQALRAVEAFTTAAPEDQPKLAAPARAGVNEFAAIFPLIDKAQCRKDCVVSAGMAQDPNWPDWMFVPSGIKGLQTPSVVLQSKALLDARDGDIDAAVDDLIRNLRLGEAAASHPRGVISGASMRCRFVRTTLATALDIAHAHPFDTPQAHRLYMEFAKIDLDSLYLEGQKADRAQLCSLFDASRRDMTAYLYALLGTVPVLRVTPYSRALPNPLPEDGNPPMPGKLTRFKDSVAAYLWRPISYKDEQCYIQRYNESLKLSRLPYRMALKQGSPAPLYARITGLPHCRPFINAWLVRDKDKAYIGLGMLAMALQAYHSKFGHYPPSFADLRPYPRWKLPEDPFSGKPLVYRRSSGGFTIYSIGPDLKDDGGKPLNRRTPQTGDIVMTCGQ